MGAAGDNGGAIGWKLPDAKADPTRGNVVRDGPLRGAGPALTPEEALQGRCIDDTGDRHTVLDQRDVDREFAILRNEFLGAVERIDEKEPVRHFGDRASGGGFFRDHRNGGIEFGKARQDDALGRLVGVGDRRQVTLCLG